MDQEISVEEQPSNADQKPFLPRKIRARTLAQRLEQLDIENKKLNA